MKLHKAKKAADKEITKTNSIILGIGILVIVIGAMFMLCGMAGDIEKNNRYAESEIGRLQDNFTDLRDEMNGLNVCPEQANDRLRRIEHKLNIKRITLREYLLLNP